MKKDTHRSRVPERLHREGGLREGVSRAISRETGVPEADIYGVASFFHLLSRPDKKIRVCTGLSCFMAGAEAVLDAAAASGLPAEGCSCLAACDVAPAVLRDRRVLPRVTAGEMTRAKGIWEDLRPGDPEWRGAVGPERDDPATLPINLAGSPDFRAVAYEMAMRLGTDEVVRRIDGSGLQGRGGAGFPAHVKWKSVLSQKETTRHVVLNADEGEPGTFKDREVLLRRPDLVLEGLAIAARAIGAQEVTLYLRGEFEVPWLSVERALARFEERRAFGDLRFRFHAGHGAYICGEETALLEALEGKRGMPRLKPPFPTEVGLHGKPTLMHNVETIACVPAIVERGGDWFRALGKTEPGTKLYCVSGHVARPGTYELPLGVPLDALLDAAGGTLGTLKAFSPGGASSGFLPASERTRPLDFRSLADAGSMLGSAGVVVLNDTVDMRRASLEQLRFFEEESCGQCAPCRIGTRFLHESLRRMMEERTGGADTLKHAAEAAWQMNEGSICGLGQAAPLPLMSALRHFPDEFR